MIDEPRPEDQATENASTATASPAAEAAPEGGESAPAAEGGEPAVAAEGGEGKEAAPTKLSDYCLVFETRWISVTRICLSTALHMS